MSHDSHKSFRVISLDSESGIRPEAPPLEVDEKDVSGLLAKMRLEFERFLTPIYSRQFII